MNESAAELINVEIWMRIKSELVNLAVRISKLGKRKTMFYR